ncbi:hypothetical protein [Parasitella parasitica]|uniref:Uncharacterized protein n=1 Tax=Parasitella parasitica TaxID=35722 RepID=A0A0B7NUL9_9FUNG|nr:hypothetical protein [Parasitella parasitica]
MDDEHEHIKKKLIEAATNRLRQKKLEIKFQAMMAQIVELQCQLDIVKMDASASLQSLPSSNISETQLMHFEKRFAHHKMELQHILQCKEDTKPIKKTTATSATLASSISSLLSLCSKSNGTNVMMEEDSDYSILGGSIHHHQKRRKRRHNQQKKHPIFMQNNVAAAEAASLPTAAAAAAPAPAPYLVFEDIPSYASSDVLDSSNESIAASLAYSYDYSDNNSILIQPLYRKMKANTGNRCEPSMLHSIGQTGVRFQEQNNHHRNAFDDVLSFLNDIVASDVNDDGFIQDIYDILDQQQQQQQQSQTGVTGMTASIFHVLKYFSSRGVKWIKFTIVMALAILINLKKGPNLFLR